MYNTVYFSFIFIFAISLYALVVNYKARLNILFSILGFLNSGIILTNLLIIVRNNHMLWEKMNIFFVVWTPTFYLIWSSEFTKKKILIKEYLLYLFSVLFSLSLLTNYFVQDVIITETGYKDVFGPLINIFFVYYAMCFIYGLVLILKAYLNSISKIERIKYFLSFIGTLIPISTSLFLNIILRFLKLDLHYSANITVLPITSSIMMVFFGYAVLRYGFLKPDIRIKEKLDTLRIKIIYVTNILIIIFAFIISVYFILEGSDMDKTIVRSLIVSIIVLVIIDFTISVFLSKYIRERIVNPIEKISRHAEEVGKGNFSNKVGFEGDDEISTLSRLMDEMTEKLKKTSEIRENFNKALQIEVQNKTAKLQEAYDQLKEADKAKKDFIDAIAHELYNPLAIITLSDEFINWDTIDPDNKKMITSIHRNVKRLNELVKEIEEFNLIGHNLNKEFFDKPP